MAWKFNPLTGELDYFVPDTTNSPGGSDTQVQFNDDGAFSGDSGLTYNKTTNFLTIDGGIATNGIAGQTVVFNESGADADFRIKSDTDANMLFVDASTNRIGVGLNNPSHRFDIADDTANYSFRIINSNADGSGAYLYVNNQDNDKFILSLESTFGAVMHVRNDGKIGIGTNAPVEALTVIGSYEIKNQNSATKSYRFRTSGSDLDLDFGGANLVLSGYPNADYTGTQKIYAIMGGTFDFVTWYGNHEWKDRSGSAVQHLINPEGDVVVNEQGTATKKLRVEGDTDQNLLCTDPGDDRVGIGTDAPNEKLEVVGNVRADGLRLDITPTAETPTMTHTFTISLNGTNYKIPVVAA